MVPIAVSPFCLERVNPTPEMHNAFLCISATERKRALDSGKEYDHIFFKYLLCAVVTESPPKRYCRIFELDIV